MSELLDRELSVVLASLNGLCVIIHARNILSFPGQIELVTGYI